MLPKKYRFISSAALVVLGLVVAIVMLARHGQIQAAASEKPAPAVQNPPAAAAQPQELPPGTITHTAKAVTTAQFLARGHLSESSYMTVAEYVDAIAKANNGKTTFKKGDVILIPGIEPQPIVEKTRPFPKDTEVRAIYLTGGTAGSAHGIDLVRRWKQAGGNAVVFDIKDSDALDMHVIARQALFRDDNIAQRHSELAVQSRGLHQPWRENGKLVWSDSSNKQVQDYNIALAKYVAGSGVDEIQFDYVRFPAEGNQADAQFAFQKDPTTKIHRDDVIANFLDHAYTELHPMGVLVSLDVFGIMAWQRQVDLSHTGQDITKMAKHCDVISPMIYPSHFFGMDGYKAPGDAPEHFISVSMDRFEKVTAGTGVVLRPWLQAFRWRTKTYSPEYILKQVSTAKGHHGDGFLFWNAANDYSKPFAAMPTMMANPKTYLYTPPTAVAENNPAAINPEKTATSQGATHSRP